MQINAFGEIAIYSMFMIKLIQQGKYKLSESVGLTKILTLDDKNMFAWINAAGIGEILVTTQRKHKAAYLLAIGKYRMYEVKDEPMLTDLVHVELLVGDGRWQGYLLPTGLPNSIKIRNRIIPTEEVITKSTY